jgi:hypothetical protein
MEEVIANWNSCKTWGPSQALERSCDRNGIRIRAIQIAIELCRIIGLFVSIQEEMETGNLVEVMASECVKVGADSYNSRHKIHDLYY